MRIKAEYQPILSIRLNCYLPTKPRRVLMATCYDGMTTNAIIKSSHLSKLLLMPPLGNCHLTTRVFWHKPFFMMQPFQGCKLRRKNSKDFRKNLILSKNCSFKICVIIIWINSFQFSLNLFNFFINIYRDKIFQCMTSTKELIGIHNDSAHKELVEIYNRRTKVGKVN